MISFISIPEISIYIFINLKISIKRCKNVEFFTKNALQTAKCKILFKIVEKVSKYEKNNTIHNGCWRSGPEVFLVRMLARKISGVQSTSGVQRSPARPDLIKISRLFEKFKKPGASYSPADIQAYKIDIPLYSNKLLFITH